MQPFTKYIMPSLSTLRPTREAFSEVTAPVLIIHGRQDRSAAYGGGRDWARLLPNARLLTIESAAHIPWIEEPDLVMHSIRSFLNGTWPDLAERVASES